MEKENEYKKYSTDLVESSIKNGFTGAFGNYQSKQNDFSGFYDYGYRETFDCFEMICKNELNKKRIYHSNRIKNNFSTLFQDKEKFTKAYELVCQYLQEVCFEDEKYLKTLSNPYKIEHLNNIIKSYKKALVELEEHYKLGLKNYDKAKRKFKVYSILASLNDKKENVVDFFKDTWPKLLAGSIVSALVLGPAHHIGYMIRKNVETNKYMSKIALEVENDCKLSSFSTEALVAGLGDDNQQYVAVIGKALTNGGKKQELFQANYTVPQDIYDNLHYYYTVHYDRNFDSSEVAYAEMQIRDGIDGVFTGYKARENLYKIIDNIYDAVKEQEPASYYTISNFDGLDININTKTTEEELNA